MLFRSTKGELVKSVKLDKDTGAPVDPNVQRQELEGGAEINLSDADAEALLRDKTILTAKDYDVLKAAKDAGLVVDATPAKLMLEAEVDLGRTGSIAR